MATISVVVSAYNEELSLARCLSSVSWADEIIVVDNSSSDATAAIARKYTKKVFRQTNHLMLNINKNYGFSKATGDYILNLDADEEVPRELAGEIRSVVKNRPDIAGFWIARKNMLFGKWIQHGLWWPDKQLRLFARGKGRFPEKHIHEYIEIVGKTEELKEPYIHHNYDTVSQYLTKLARCTTSEALALTETNYQVAWFDALRFPLSDFLKTYFAQEGYKDGLHGIVLSLFQAFYSFVVFAKLWEKERFTQKQVVFEAVENECRRGIREFSYWMLTTKIKEASSPFTKLILKIRRKFTE